MNSSKNLSHAIRNLNSLPAIPSIAKKVLALKINTDESEHALLELIEKDPPLLSKIIGMANSPVFGVGREILTLHDAAALLGSKRIKMTALSLSMISSMARNSGGLLNVNKLWKHSLSVTMTMETLAFHMPTDIRPPDDEIHLSGMLIDIGFLVLNYLDPLLSDEFQTRLASEPDCPLETIEADMLEMNHCELGAELARHWDLPESIIAVLRYHHAPYEEKAAIVRPLAVMANLAEKLLPLFGTPQSDQLIIPSQVWQTLEIDPLKNDKIKLNALEHVKQVDELNI